jgi:hypothetical protein
MANDEPAEWGATAITPHGVYMTASYGEGESGPSGLVSTFFPNGEQTTLAMGGARTVMDQVSFGVFSTYSSEELAGLIELIPERNFYLTSTPRFYNNTAEFF